MASGVLLRKLSTSGSLAAGFILAIELGQFSDFSPWLNIATVVLFAIIPVQYLAWREAFYEAPSQFSNICAIVGNLGLALALALLARHYSFEHCVVFVISGCVICLLALKFGSFPQ